MTDVLQEMGCLTLTLNVVVRVRRYSQDEMEYKRRQHIEQVELIITLTPVKNYPMTSHDMII